MELHVIVLEESIFPRIQSKPGCKKVVFKDINPSILDFPEPWRWVKSRCVVSNGRRGANRKEYVWYDTENFGDRMKRIPEQEPSHTIVAHLCKDGYMYLHPEPNTHRTITVREAARLQSFPDHFDFSAGGAVNRSEQFRQVGNAVPPLLALVIANEIETVLQFH